MINREEFEFRRKEECDMKIKITETVLRDGQQSLMATRMPIEDFLPVLEKMDQLLSLLPVPA